MFTVSFLPKYKSLDDVWHHHKTALLILFWLIFVGLSLSLGDSINSVRSLNSGEFTAVNVTHVDIENTPTRFRTRHSTIISFSYRENDMLEERKLNISGKKLDHIKAGDVLWLRYDREHDLFVFPDRGYNYMQLLSNIFILIFSGAALTHYYFFYKPRKKRQTADLKK